MKYLDFFGLDESNKIEWPNTELENLLKRDFTRDGVKTNFLIPLIVYQIKAFYPKCVDTVNLNRYQNLLKLYFQIRGKELGAIQNMSIVEQLNVVRDDFYSQVMNDDLLAHMSYTMDDGPLMGVIPKRVPNFKNGKYIQTEFGRLTILKNSGKIYLIATDTEQRIIWVRIMTGVGPKNYIRNLDFKKNAVEKTSLATKVHLYNAERLTLYLRNDGRFLYYFHSW